MAIILLNCVMAELKQNSINGCMTLKTIMDIEKPSIMHPVVFVLSNRMDMKLSLGG